MTITLPELARNAELSATVEHEIREVVRESVFLILAAEGDVDYGRVRQFLPEWATGPTPGATICAMVRAGELEAIPGRTALLGNTKHRAGGRLIKVYRRGSK